jgi:hypothetical protein
MIKSLTFYQDILTKINYCRISLAEIQSRNEFDTNRDGSVSEDEAKVVIKN